MSKLGGRYVVGVSQIQIIIPNMRRKPKETFRLTAPRDRTFGKPLILELEPAETRLGVGVRRQRP